MQKDNISYKNKIVIIVLQSVAFCFAGICIEYEIKYYEESSKDAWIMIILVAYVVVLNLTKRVIQYKANDNTKISDDEVIQEQPLTPSQN